MCEQKNIDLFSRGIICDNPKCDFKDETVGLDDWQAWLNKPCPKCQENLLTEEDLLTARTLYAIVKMQNSLDPVEHAMIFGKPSSTGERKVYHINTHKGLTITEAGEEKPE